MGKVSEYTINKIYPNRSEKNIKSIVNVPNLRVSDIRAFSNGEQRFEMRCKCEGKSFVVTEKYVANKTSKDSIKMKQCDDCGRTISYRALPNFKFKFDDSSKLQNFDFKCNKCPSKTLYMTEDEARELAKRHHNGCGGRVSYGKLSADFVMPTWWAHHWNELEKFEDNKDLPDKDKQQSHYTLNAIRDNILYDIEELIEKGQSDKRFETIFLKRRHEYCPVSYMAWKGSVYGFKKELRKDGKERIYFKVYIQQEIHLPEIYAGSDYRDEWYRFKNNV